MNIFALSSLVTSAMTALLGVLVLSRNPRKGLNITFCLSCLTGSWASFAEFGYRQAESFTTALFWLRISALALLSSSFDVHFFLYLTGKTRLLGNKLTYLLLYIPGLVFFISDLMGLTGTQPVRAYWGWTYTSPRRTLLLELSEAWFILCGIGGLLLCLHYYWRGAEGKRKQIGLVTAGLFTPVALAIISQPGGLFDYWDIAAPEFTSVGFAFESALVTYAIWKYELFALTPATAAERIVATLADALFLVNREGRIVTVNAATSELLGYEEGALIGQPVGMIFAQKEMVGFEQTWLERLRETGSVRDAEIAIVTKDNQSIPVSLSVSVVRDEGGAEQGIVYVGRDLTERKQAEEALRGAEAEVRQRLREQIALREAGAAIASTLDPIEVLSRIAEQMAKAVDATSAYISSYEPTTLLSTVLAEYIGPAANTAEQVSDLGVMYEEDGKSRFWERMQSGQHDVSHIDDLDLLETQRVEMERYGAKTILYIPLMIKRQLVGYAELWESRRRRKFTPEEIALCHDIARQAAVALENARLFEQAQQEIVERKRVEEQIRASLREKEVLLKEIHHRVKNNLQIVSSLLSLQANYVSDQQAFEALRESLNRVHSMGVIHEVLYQSLDLAQVDFGEFTQRLVDHLFRMYGVESQAITLRMDVSEVPMSIDTAIYCGLIVNELVSNSLKYAFPAGRAGEICIGLHSDNENHLTLTVSDNGISLPSDVEQRKVESLGLQLVAMLTEQLEGTAEFDPSSGTAFRIMFSQ
jgi:PAS domain S-box-containing protein